MTRKPRSSCQNINISNVGYSQARREKMERHCSIETAFSIASKRFICISVEILIAAQQSRTGNEKFWKWNGRFRSDRTNRPRGPPLEVDHFDRKISTQTKASHLFFDQNFRKFWYNGKQAFRAEPSCILQATIRNAPTVSSKVEEKGSPATSFITELGA